MKLKPMWIWGNREVERPIRDLDELMGEPKREPVLGGGMERDLESAITVNRILASRNRFKKTSEESN